MRKIILFAILLISLSSLAAAQTTEFTYQGNLNVSNSPASGNYDFEFALFDALTSGTQLGSTLTRNGVTIANGTFSVKLDFGSQFPGANRYLEIRVRQSGGGAFVPLTPRPQINSTPYSIKSVNSDNAANATNALQLGGVPAGNYLQTNGSGAGLTNLSASSITSGTLNNARLPNPLLITGSFGVGNGIVVGRNLADDGTGIYGEAQGTTGRTFGVRGTYTGSNTGGAGVYGDVTNANTGGAGVQGNSPNGAGVYGISENGTGVRGIGPTGIGVFGSSTTGFAGYFQGKSYFASVGIGSTEPAARLDVFATGVNRTLVGGGNVTGSEIKLTSDSTAHFSIYNAGNGNLTFANTSTTTATNTAGSPLMAMTSAGNVGIGMTNPGFRLHVNGETRTNTLSVDSFVANNGGPALCANTSNNRIAVCASSSLRYKANVRNYGPGLDLVRSLRPIRFTWLDGGAEDIGLAAEEVAADAPDLAFYKDGQIEGVKYDRIGLVLINAVKEQQAEIENLENENGNLRRQLFELGDTLKAQKQELHALKMIVCSLRPKATACRPWQKRAMNIGTRSPLRN